MGMFGNILGSIAGGLGSSFMPLPGVNGAQIGGQIGGLLPFKKGGKIPGKRGKPIVILAHGGEFMLPAGVPPTRSQRSAVARKNRRKPKK